MASKLSAARIASWSGSRAVIARAGIPDVLDIVVGAAVDGTASVGTTFHPSERTFTSKQLWVGFASEVCGRVFVDDGATTALARGTVSLLPAGVSRVEGDFEAGDTIEVVGADGVVLARGTSLMNSSQAATAAGRRSNELDDGFPPVVVHRDTLVLLPR